VEQRIGSSSQPLKNEPVKGAGFDPAFVPGLTPPVPPAPEPEPADARPRAAEPSGPAADAGVTEATAAKTAESADSSGADAPDGPEDSAAHETPGGPVFEAADRRARIVADREGVRLALDDQRCEFRWDEIGAVETATPRFGKRFTVTVHTPDRRWYPIEIEAPARSRFAEWEKQLDEVLDAYFDDGEQEQSAKSAELAESAESASAASAESPESAGSAGSAVAGKPAARVTE
jgi:hypothetical protein